MDMLFKLNGKLLDLGARFNSASLCGLVFGHVGMPDNSRALRIAFEHKSYAAAGAMLDRAAGFVVPGPCDFAFGKDWDLVKEIAKADPRAGALMRRYDEQGDLIVDKLLGPAPGKSAA
jgi:hypothetical protein